MGADRICAKRRKTSKPPPHFKSMKKEDKYIGRALVACEYSGTVRDALSAKGWDAWSCDLLPTESEQTKAEGKHYQCDVFDVINKGWDLMVAGLASAF